jgi:Domain of unknown function (DUF4365)
MDLNARKEQFSNAFLLAVAAVAGCSVAKPSVDNDSIDWTISDRRSRRPKLDIQLKCTSDANGTAALIAFALKKKNYDDLTVTNLISPRILVLVVVPELIEDWIALNQNELALRHRAFWMSLVGQPPTTNETSVTIHIPRSQALTVESLDELMAKTDRGAPL